MDRNDERWGIYGEKYADYISENVSSKLFSFADHVEYLGNWISLRWEVIGECMDLYLKGEGELQN